MLEPLESRIAPATFVNAHIVTYSDLSGDKVTINSSLPIFTGGSSGNVNTILHFNTGSVNGSNTQDQQLQTITLGSGVAANHDSLSITVAGGKSYADVGYINSSYALGNVTVQGDLGGIQAGVEGPASITNVGLANLTVHSLGAQGTSTQAAGGTLLSSIFGAVGSITVQTDFVNANFSVASNTTGTAVNGNIHSIYIGGNLVGGADTPGLDNSTINSGYISTSGSVGSIYIGGSIEGGSGANSGSLSIGGSIGSMTIGGNIAGYQVTGDTTGQGAGSASISTGSAFLASGSIGSLTVKGNIIGGDGAGSAEISNSSGINAGNIGTVKIGGSVTGGIGANSAEFYSGSGSIGPVTIGGTLTGGSGANSGEIDGALLGSITIGKGLVGSSGNASGSIFSNNGIGAISILSGGITGGTAANSGAIIAGFAPTSRGSETVSSIVIHGDLTSTATAGEFTTNSPGQINSAVPIGTLTIYGSLIGSASADSGAVIDSEPISHLAIHTNGTQDPGSLEGGAGNASGQVTALSFSTISIAGQITGSTGTGSGVVSASLGIGSISAGGLAGGIGNESGQITATETIGSVHLTGAIAGGAGTASGGIFAGDNVGPIVASSLTYGTGVGSGQISVGGNLTSLSFTGVSGSAPAVTGAVNVTGNAGSILVKGNVVGSGTDTAIFEIGGAVNDFNISGALQGGAGTDSGSIFAGLDDISRIGTLTISGGITGAGGVGSGEVFAGGGITAATLGDVIGGGGQYSGSIFTDGSIGALTVTGLSSSATHGIVGGSGAASGVVSSGTTIGSATVHGGIVGGAGARSGVLASNSTFSPTLDVQGNIGSILVTGSVTGGTGANSGQISAAGNVTSLSIAGSVTGSGVSGTGAVLAGVDLTSLTGGNITTLKIGGALTGGNIAANAGTVAGSGYVLAGHIGSATIGSIQAGTVGAGDTVTDDGAILAANDIASLTVSGAIQGDVSNAVTISAVGQLVPGKVDLAFGKISVGGNVSYTNFLAGYDQSGAAVNGAASMGPVSIGGNWSGSNLVAGVIAPSGGGFGSARDTLITSSNSVIPTIASIIIKGHVTSATTPGAADTYGFVAKQIGSFSVGGHAQSLSLGIIDPVDQSVDAVLREVTSLSPAS